MTLKSVTEIAKQLNLDASTVRRYVRAHNLKPQQIIKTQIDRDMHSVSVRLYDLCALLPILQCIRKRRAS